MASVDSPNETQKPGDLRHNVTWNNRTLREVATDVLKQIAEQAAPGGKLYSAEIWHEQFKRMFIGVIELPDGTVQGMSSTELDTAQFCEFCDKVEAYAATELGVTFYDLQGHA